LLRFGCFVFAALALLNNQAAAQATNSQCLSALQFASKLTAALDSLHLSEVQAINTDIAQHCASTLSPDIEVIADAATLFTFIHRRNNGDSAQQAFNRLLLRDFTSLPRRQQAAYYHLMALYSLHTGEYKQALSISHIISTELLPAAVNAADDMAAINLAVADIHYEIEFYQSVRELLLPLLTHPAHYIRVRAASLL